MSKMLTLISFSNHFDHQTMMYDLSHKINLQGENVTTLGIVKPKYNMYFKNYNFFFKAPLSPGLTLSTFNLVSFFKIAFRLLKLKPYKIVFLTSHIWNLPLIVLLRIFIKDIRIVHSVHDFIPHQGDKSEKSVDKYNKLITKLVDNIIIYSKNGIDIFSKKYQFSENRIIYLEYWKIFDTHININNYNNFLFLGRINYYKGVQNFESIVKNCPKANFTFVGRVDRGLEKYIENLKKYPNVTLNTNYVFGDELAKYFIDSTFVFLPYNSATMSGIIIESYKFSRPVIAFNVGGLSEQICNHFSGFLIEDGNISKFTEKINECLNLSSKEIDQLSINAYEYGYRKYSIDISTEVFINKIIKEELNNAV